MPTATISNATLPAWPPVSTHVHLETPWTDHLGESHTDLVVTQQGPEYGGDQHCCWVYDCLPVPAVDDDGEPTGAIAEILPTPGMMMALRKFDYITVESVLSQMGFTVTQ